MPHTCLCTSLAEVVSACALAREASAVETMLEGAMLEGAVAVLEGEVLEWAMLSGSAVSSRVLNMHVLPSLKWQDVHVRACREETALDSHWGGDAIAFFFAFCGARLCSRRERQATSRSSQCFGHDGARFRLGRGRYRLMYLP